MSPVARVIDVLSYFPLSFGVRLLSLSKAFYLLGAAAVSDPPGSQLCEAMSLVSLSLGRYADLGSGR